MNDREPFLKQVARCYVENERDKLLDYCFVTPNKRSGVFLSKYIGEMLVAHNGVSLNPMVMTISDLVSDLTGTVEASRIEQLFILYNVYAGILTEVMTPDELARGNNLIDFNKFQYWGDILLNDFNDVDKYVIDAAQLFRNVENLKEISANFLTPEQIEVIRRYWNEDFVPEPVKEFWNHAVHVSAGNDSTDKKNVAGFVKLWQVMHRIYIEFRKRLRESSMTYSGMAYRDALERIQCSEAEDFSYRRYIFVGFNTLSVSERKIFSSLRDLGIADFYWDYASPAFSITGNSASRFLKPLVEEFRSLYNAGQNVVEDYPDVEVIALPSTVGQVKLVEPLLRSIYPELFNDKSENQDILVNTAVVLPDENLSIPLLNSLPAEIKDVNITMGYSLRQTPVASLLKNIISLQLRARKLKYENTFYYEDVLSVLSHPLVRNAEPAQCDAVVRMINENRMFNIPVSALDNEQFDRLAPIFQVVENVNDPMAVFGYIERLLKWLLEILNVNSPIDGELGIVTGGSPVLEAGFVRSYQDALAELRRLSAKYLEGNKIYLEDKTVFHLVERIAGNQSVAFEGMPLRGLQVMGVLETRNLDFENVIILSMNERIFPRKHYSKSFIPNALRRGYGMASLDHQESIYAYYFYRLITRAGKVFLLYDARTTGVRSGDVSRYINQIKYFFPAGKVHVSFPVYPLLSSSDSPMTIKKTPEIMSCLERFFSETNRRSLSASSINEYINCPVQFYLSHIERYYAEDEIKDYMDEGTYGTIIHETVENIYMDQKGDRAELEISDMLLKKLCDDRLIGGYLERSIKKNYLKMDPDDQTELKGDAAIFHKIMTRSIKLMFEREMELGRFNFIQGEKPVDVMMELPSGLKVNVTCRIDRIDRAFSDNGVSYIRLIDYKTGGDILKTPSVDALFDGTRANRPKAILQLLLYSAAYSVVEKYDGAIQPVIYKFRTMSIEPITPLKIGREPVEDWRDWKDEFIGSLDSLLQEMVDQNVPFVARPSDHACKYCKFKEFCRS